MAKNDKDAKYIRHIARRVNFVSNGGEWKMHKIDRCEGGLKLEYISIKNVGENNLNTKMK